MRGNRPGRVAGAGFLALGRRATTRGLMIAAPAPQAPVVHPRLSGGALFASDMDG